LGYTIAYQVVVSNAGPGPAYGVQVTNLVPLGSNGLLLNWDYAANGYHNLQDSTYASNDLWRQNNPNYFDGYIARGPFFIPANQSVTLTFVLDVGYGISGSLEDDASAKDSGYGLVAQATPLIVPVAASGVVPSVTNTYSVTPTFSVSPTITPTNSPTGTPTPSPTQTPTTTLTPVPPLALAKSSNKVSVNLGDTLTWVLSLHNASAGPVSSVSVWDTLPAAVGTPLGWQPASGVWANGVLSWAVLTPVPAGAYQSFTISARFGGGGTDLPNQAAAGTGSGAGLLSNLVDVAVGGTFTYTNSPTPSASPTTTPSPTATVTPVPIPPHLFLTLTQNQGQPWVGGQDLGFGISFGSLTGCACAPATDLLLTFYGDVTSPDQNELDVVQGMSQQGLGGPGDPTKNFYWRYPYPNSPSIIVTGLFGLAPGSPAIPRQVYAHVQAIAVNQPITSQVVLSSAAWGLALTATVSTYISSLPPTPTPIPSATATPVAQLGKVVAYPQPAHDTVCIAYYAPGPGPLQIEVFNAAFKRVAVITDTAQGGHMETACVPIGKLATGVYFYRAKVGDFSFPVSQFGVAK
jgi:uncharacterized repeat protein (TIGR01451 family)